MKSRKMMHMAAKIKAGILLSMIFAGGISIARLPAFQGDASATVGKLKSTAEAQHEIIMILLKQKEYEKALAEANKIFDMKWPADQEALLLDELLILTKAFKDQGQAALGLKLADRNLGCFKKNSSQAALWKEKGYLHNSLGREDKALECFKKARDLEGGK